MPDPSCGLLSPCLGRKGIGEGWTLKPSGLGALSPLCPGLHTGHVGHNEEPLPADAAGTWLEGAARGHPGGVPGPPGAAPGAAAAGRLHQAQVSWVGQVGCLGQGRASLLIPTLSCSQGHAAVCHEDLGREHCGSGCGGSECCPGSAGEGYWAHLCLHTHTHAHTQGGLDVYLARSSRVMYTRAISGGWGLSMMGSCG